jgi:hypothetical protein
MLTTFEEQRRWVQSIVAEAYELHSRMVSSVSEARSHLDQTIARVSQPMNGADRILVEAKAETVRISAIEAGED